MVKPAAVEPKEEPRSGSDEREAPEQTIAPSRPSPYSHVQYCVYTSHPNFRDLMTWVEAQEIPYEVHLNRSRFWMPKGSKIYTEFVLRWFHSTSEVIE
jgi:hypothetical protein